MRRKPNDPVIEHQGLVHFASFADGSKSESTQPFLETDTGQTIRLHIPGDNPFSNDRLKEFDQKRCKIRGQFNKDKNLISISEISAGDGPPALSSDSADRKDNPSSTK